MTTPAIDLPTLIAANQKRWDDAKFSPRKLQVAESVAKRLCAAAAKAIYKELEAVTGVPWYIIAVIHEREASQKWDRNIAQGDPFNAKSVHVPKGRGPFPDFKSAAIDALTNCAPYAAKWKDWSEGGALTILELYNGLGYERFHHEASPYLWAGTDQYVHGKYVADGKFSETAVDSQLGCAVLLKQMAATDPDCTFGAPPKKLDTFEGQPEEGSPPEIDPATYPVPLPTARPAIDPDTPPPASYVDGPPPANTTPLPAPKADDDDAPAGIVKTVKDAVAAKIGTKTVTVGTAGATTAIATADQSWFDWIAKEAHNPRVWIIGILVIAACAFIVYKWVQEHKEKT